MQSLSDHHQQQGNEHTSKGNIHSEVSHQQQHHHQTDTLTKLIFKLTGVAILFRLMIILWILVVDYLVKDYDSSSYADIALINSNNSTISIGRNIDQFSEDQAKTINYTFGNPLYYGRGFAHWDGVFFLRIASKGQYEYESFFAFFPFYPMTIRTVTLYVIRPFMTALTYFTNIRDSNNYGDLTPFMISGVLISNICFVISVGIFIKLTWELVGRNSYYTHFVRTSALLYIFNPATVFMSVVYTESMFSLFSLCGMYYHVRKRHIFSCLFFALATCTRGNGIALAGFYIYQFMLEEYLRWKNSKRDDLTRNISKTIMAFLKYIVFGCFIVWLPYVAFQAYGYYQFCTEQSNQLALTIIQSLNDSGVNTHFQDYLAQVHPWCLTRIPHLYSYVQSKYWNVGFLKYYELKQVPNFILAFPVVSALLKWSTLCVHADTSSM
nr:unnamed protein product [Naegleria fowleri]